MSKQVGLRFILEHGAFIQVTLLEDEAKQIVQNWMSGWYGVKGLTRVGDGAAGWAVLVSSIVAIHTLPLEAPPMAGLGKFRGGSGL